MKVYTLRRKQFLPIGIEEAWAFFSTPANLSRITPTYMKFRIIHASGNGSMFCGQIIRYRLFVLPLVPWHWTTEITYVKEPHCFIDEQMAGPYTLWQHRHNFDPVDGGVEMSDEVRYAVPFGFIGHIINGLLIRRQLNRIFEYRFNVLEEIFSKNRMDLGKTA